MDREMTPSERTRWLRAERSRLGLCIACGRRKARAGRRSCRVCAKREAERPARQRYSPHGQHAPHRCSSCGDLGHHANHCDGPAVSARAKECCRCTAPRVAGTALCQDHLDTLAELEREEERAAVLERARRRQTGMTAVRR